ncbi:MAG TPA: DUF1707 domain-containing protein [Actinomycetes bacterium]
MPPPAEPDPTRAPEERPPAAATPAPAPATPAIRASDKERDTAVERLQVAFAEGRIDDQEFDERMRSALTARTRADLDRLLADLPRPGALATVEPQPTGRLLLAMKGGVQRRGRWRVPERLNAVAYKGACEVDLRAAELSAASTAITAVAYKGRVEILVPPGVRVQVRGYSYGGHWDDQVPDDDLPPDAPVVHVQAVAYKGTVEARPTPGPRGEITRG